MGPIWKRNIKRINKPSDITCIGIVNTIPKTNVEIEIRRDNLSTIR